MAVFIGVDHSLLQCASYEHEIWPLLLMFPKTSHHCSTVDLVSDYLCSENRFRCSSGVIQFDLVRRDSYRRLCVFVSARLPIDCSFDRSLVHGSGIILS